MTDWKWILSNKIVHRRRYKYYSSEFEVKKFAKTLKGNLFIDIGSNRKAYANILRKNFKQILTIDANIKWHPDLNVAISNFNGPTHFYIGDNKGGADSLLHNPHILGKEWVNNPSEYMVEALTFDTLKLKADLVKIDVEGGEFNVLEGMVKYIPKMVIVELHDERREQELVDVLMAKHYSVHKIDGTHFYGEQI